MNFEILLGLTSFQKPQFQSECVHRCFPLYVRGYSSFLCSSLWWISWHSFFYGNMWRHHWRNLCNCVHNFTTARIIFNLTVSSVALRPPPPPLFVGSNRPIFGYRWAAEGLKPWPFLGQKIPKMRTPFSTTPSILLPCLGQNRANLLSLIVIAFVYLEYKQNSSREVSWSIVQPGRPRRNYIPCLGQRGQNQCPGYRYISVWAIYIREYLGLVEAFFS